jgi:hypothetical protein
MRRPPRQLLRKTIYLRPPRTLPPQRHLVPRHLLQRTIRSAQPRTLRLKPPLQRPMLRPIHLDLQRMRRPRKLRPRAHLRKPICLHQPRKHQPRRRRTRRLTILLDPRPTLPRQMLRPRCQRKLLLRLLPRTICSRLQRTLQRMPLRPPSQVEQLKRIHLVRLRTCLQNRQLLRPTHPRNPIRLVPQPNQRRPPRRRQI